MTTYRTQSAEVLNEADRFEDILDWMLFAQDQEALLWSDPDSWVPGNPIHKHPLFVHDGQYVRPMFEEMPIDQFHNRDRVPAYERCTDCAVSWYGDDPCWNCGAECPARFSPFEEYQAIITSDTQRFRSDMELQAIITANTRTFDEEIVRVMSEQMRVAASSMRDFGGALAGASPAISWVDEASTIEDWCVPTYQIDSQGRFFVWEPAVTPRPETVDIMSLEHLFPNVSTRRHGRTQRAELMSLLADIDLSVRPTIPEPVIARRNVALEAYLARQNAILNTPATERRRPRT